LIGTRVSTVSVRLIWVKVKVRVNFGNLGLWLRASHALVDTFKDHLQPKHYGRAASEPQP